MKNWLHVGNVLGVAVDQDRGTMQFALTERFEAKPPNRSQWITAFESKVNTSAVVGSGLFPALSGGKGVKVRYNFGFKREKMIHTPPVEDFRTIAEIAQEEVWPKNIS